MKHPLDFIPEPARKATFFAFLALTVACMAAFQIALDPPLRTVKAPGGIVSYELAGTVKNAQDMLDSWDGRARLFNAFGLGFDFLFMPVYASALSAGTLMAASRRRGAWSAWGGALGWGSYLAIVFDSIENIFLFSMLIAGVATGSMPQIAAVCAALKFLLIVLGVLYGLVGWLLPQK